MTRTYLIPLSSNGTVTMLAQLFAVTHTDATVKKDHIPNCQFEPKSFEMTDLLITGNNSASRNKDGKMPTNMKSLRKSLDATLGSYLFLTQHL